MPHAPLSPCAPGEVAIAVPDGRRGFGASPALVVRAGAALAMVAAAGLGGAAFLARAITGPTRRSAYYDYVFTPFEAGIPFQEVAIPACDGTLLRGWWMPRGPDDPVVVCCPYYRGRKANLMGIAGALWRSGLSALVFDYRGHGDHAGTPVTLGYQEVEDLLAAVTVVEQLAPGVPVGVIGYSMGAAVAIMGAARQPAIRAVVADSAFARQAEAIVSGARQQLHVPVDPLLPLVELLVRRQLGYRFRDVEPLRDVPALAGRPLLIIHGEQDAVIPVENARRLYAAAEEPKELWIVPGAGHCGAYFADRSHYCRRVAAFFAAALRAPAGAGQPADPVASGAHTGSPCSPTPLPNGSR